MPLTCSTVYTNNTKTKHTEANFNNDDMDISTNSSKMSRGSVSDDGEAKKQNCFYFETPVLKNQMQSKNVHKNTKTRTHPKTSAPSNTWWRVTTRTIRSSRSGGCLPYVAVAGRHAGVGASLRGPDRRDKEVGVRAAEGYTAHRLPRQRQLLSRNDQSAAIVILILISMPFPEPNVSRRD